MTGAAFVKDVTLIAPERVYEQLTRPDLTHRFSKQTYIDSLKDLECHEEAAEIEAAVVPLPQFCFEESLILHLPALTFEIRRLGGHSAACSSVYVPEEGVLFASDVVINGPSAGMRDANLGEWIRSLAWIESLPVQTIVPGHGEICGKEVAKALRERLSAIRGTMAELVQKGRTKAEAAVVISQMIDFFPYRQGEKSIIEKRIRAGVSRVYDEMKVIYGQS